LAALADAFEDQYGHSKLAEIVQQPTHGLPSSIQLDDPSSWAMACHQARTLSQIGTLDSQLQRHRK
jgi:hypothetical protein